MDRIEIPMKLPSLNEYVNSCRTNRYASNSLKQNLEKNISYYIKDLPSYKKPIRIHFHWVEGNKRRDYDNICFSKKFILDALVKSGKLKDDNRKCVTGFVDTFEYSDTTKVILEIEEIDNG